MTKTKPDDLAKIVGEELDEFYNLSLEDLREAAKAAGKAAVKELKSKSPGDAYPKEWTSKAENPRTGANVIIYNKKKYMLAHLLEYGHPKVNGGRVPGNVHIQPVEKMAKEKFEEELRRRIESGA